MPVLSNLICSVLVLVFSLFFGCLPLISKKINIFSPAVRWTDEKKKFLLAFLLNFGGGVLIANCFCHWLPEAREGKFQFMPPLLTQEPKKLNNSSSLSLLLFF